MSNATDDMHLSISTYCMNESLQKRNVELCREVKELREWAEGQYPRATLQNFLNGALCSIMQMRPAASMTEHCDAAFAYADEMFKRISERYPYPKEPK